MAAKTKFKDWLGTNQHGVNAPGIWVGENLERDSRVKEMVAGKVKRALCELKENRKDVVNDWRRGQVFVGLDLVAKWENGKMLLLSEEVVRVEGRIKELMKDVGMDEVLVCKSQ